jgi:hypothetical protein
MLAGGKGHFIKSVSLFLIITFISLDISWAYPARIPAGADKLQAELAFQPDVMTGKNREFKESLFSDIKVLLSVYAVADYLFGDESKGSKPLPSNHLESVLRNELGDIAEGLDLSRVGEENGVITIPVTCGEKKGKILVAKREGLSAKELAGYHRILSDKYVITAVPEGYTEALRIAEDADEDPEIIISEPIIEIVEDLPGTKLPGKWKKIIVRVIKTTALSVLIVALTSSFVPAYGATAETVEAAKSISGWTYLIVASLVFIVGYVLGKRELHVLDKPKRFARSSVITAIMLGKISNFAILFAAAGGITSIVYGNVYFLGLSALILGVSLAMRTHDYDEAVAFVQHTETEIDEHYLGFLDTVYRLEKLRIKHVLDEKYPSSFMEELVDIYEREGSPVKRRYLLWLVERHADGKSVFHVEKMRGIEEKRSDKDPKLAGLLGRLVGWLSDDLKKGRNIHAFRATDGIKAAIVTGVIASVVGIVTLVMWATGRLTGYWAALPWVDGYLWYAAVKYFVTGLSTKDTLVIDAGFDPKKAWHEPISSNNGYRHRAFEGLPSPVERVVSTHEGFRSHFLGMLSMLPAIWILFHFQYSRSVRRAEQYAMVNSGSAGSIYEVIHAGYADMIERAYEHVRKTDDVEMLQRLMVLTFGRNDKLQNAVLDRLFEAGLPAVRKAIKDAFITANPTVFDRMDFAAQRSRKYLWASMPPGPAEQMADLIDKREDIDIVVSLVMYYFWKDQTFKVLEEVTGTRDSAKRVFLIEKIWLKLKEMRRMDLAPSDMKVRFDERYERMAAEKLADTLSAAYGTVEVSEERFQALMEIIGEKALAQDTPGPACTHAAMLAENEKELRETVEKGIADKKLAKEPIIEKRIAEYVRQAFNRYTFYNGRAVRVEPLPGYDLTTIKIKKEVPSWYPKDYVRMVSTHEQEAMDPMTEGNVTGMGDEEMMAALIGLESVGLAFREKGMPEVKIQVDRALSEAVHVKYSPQRTISTFEHPLKLHHDGKIAQVEVPCITVSLDLDRLGELVKEARGELAEEQGEAEAESSPSGNRERIIREASELASCLPERPRPGLGGAGNKTTAEITSAIEDVLHDIDALRGSSDMPGFSKRFISLERSTREGVRSLEAEAMISAMIILARKAKREGQSLIIGLETDWIPGSNKGDLQRDAINPLVREIESLGDKMRSMGLDNVVICHENGEGLAESIVKQAEDTSTDLSNVVVLASEKTVKSESFACLRSTFGNKRAFLAAVDTSLLRDAAPDDFQELRIRIMDMLLLALELASGKKTPALPIVKEYDELLRLVVFLPEAEPMDYDKLREIYRSQQAALVAA